ncbi:MAG: hypothetical protein ABEN55_05590 [Bradymonadaceae bacterium]
MFGYTLTHDQERSVLELLGWIATADRDISSDERQYVVELSHDFNASAEGIFQIGQEKSLDEICARFSDETAERLALMYATRLSFIDEMYEEDEWLGIREIGDTFGIPEGKVAELEDWVRRGIEWEQEGRELLRIE